MVSPATVSHFRQLLSGSGFVDVRTKVDDVEKLVLFPQNAFRRYRFVKTDETQLRLVDKERDSNRRRKPIPGVLFAPSFRIDRFNRFGEVTYDL